MFLADVNMWEVVKKQFRLKLKSYRGMFTSMMILQLLGLLLSQGGEASMGGSMGNFEYDLRFYSGNMVLVFMMLWAFISAIIMTTEAYRFDDYAFIANRFTSHLANILFLGTMSVIAGLTTLLASQVLQVVGRLRTDWEYIVSASMTVPEFMAGLGGTILYVFLFAAIGYLVGMLVQMSRLFMIILPAILFGGIFLDALLSEQPTVVASISRFFGEETSFLVFAIKVVLVSLLCLGIAVYSTNRMEVRR